jgi:hypothetical protein
MFQYRINQSAIQLNCDIEKDTLIVKWTGMHAISVNRFRRLFRDYSNMRQPSTETVCADDFMRSQRVTGATRRK